MIQINQTIEKVKDLKELSLFLVDLNKQPESHIGYCGEGEGEILEALQEDFVTENEDINFYVSRGNAGEIIAAIGLDTEETSAEVWGRSTDPLRFQCNFNYGKS